MISIVDYGMGNLGSIANMLKKIGFIYVLSSQITDLEQAEILIFPGVGAFDMAISRLQKLGIIPILNQKVLQCHTPILGICLGMQLMTQSSEEGTKQGLGWLEAKTIKFRPDKIDIPLRFPHMGWNTVEPQKYHDLFLRIEEESRFYFVHNFHVVCDDQSDVLAMTEHGYPFVSAFQHQNIWGVQFHPEKSHQFGMHFLKKWVELCYENG